MISAATALVLAVDGGGTKTALAFANGRGEIVFRARGPSSNPMDNAEWRQELDKLFSSAPGLLASTAYAMFGLPGFGEVAHLDKLMLSTAAELFPGPHRVVNDVELALSGAFLGLQGILLLAGTGSMAMAQNAEGRVVRVGGWGETFGDEGSAFWIGREALAKASEALDGRLDAIGFATGILTGLGLNMAGGNQALMSWCYGARHLRSTVASVAKIVDSLAQSGDSIALAILEGAADHLSAHIGAIGRQIGGARSVPWSYAGSVFESHAIRDNLTRRHGRSMPPRLPPIGGGLWRAAVEAGWNPEDAWINTLAVSAGKTGFGRHEYAPCGCGKAAGLAGPP